MVFLVGLRKQVFHVAHPWLSANRKALYFGLGRGVERQRRYLRRLLQPAADVLVVLAYHEKPEVQSEVAVNPATPPPILTPYAAGKTVFARVGIEENLNAHRGSCCPRDRHRGRSPPGRCQNPATPLATLDALATEENLVAHVLENLAFP